MKKLSFRDVALLGAVAALLSQGCDTPDASPLEVEEQFESNANASIFPVLESKISLFILPDQDDGGAIVDSLGIWVSGKIEIQGEISSDAFAQFEQAYQQSIDEGVSTIISLNSHGGSMREALRIAEFIAEEEIPTVIEQGAHCYSACAFIFMAGRESGGGEGPGWVSRYLHIEGKLGFHAPFLAYGPQKRIAAYDGTYGDVANAYNTGLTQIGALLTSPYTSGTRWPPSLVGEMLLTPPHQYREVLTVDDAGRWNIQLIGTPQVATELTPRQRYMACRNSYHWADEELWSVHERIEFDEVNTEEDLFSGWVEAQSPAPDQLSHVEVFRTPIDELNNLVCYIGRYEEDDDNFTHLSIRFEGEEHFGGSFPLWIAFDPDHPIAELPSIDESTD